MKFITRIFGYSLAFESIYGNLWNILWLLIILFAAHALGKGLLRSLNEGKLKDFFVKNWIYILLVLFFSWVIFF